ncbi:hypothetical protein [Streptococcus suis]|nr:hypothetical protein [Streptococcus suis]
MKKQFTELKIEKLETIVGGGDPLAGLKKSVGDFFDSVRGIFVGLRG